MGYSLDHHAVRGFLQLLGEQKNTAKYSEYIPLMISELDRANAIISEFLSISRTKTTEFARQNLNKDKGTGLGLAVCFGIAARHNAKITARTGDQGTTFLMKFALK